MIRALLLSLVATCCCLALPVAALNVDAPLTDSRQEARAQALFPQFRCVVCQGESIADSQADVAADLRRAVRHAIAAGQSDEAIIAELSTHYGQRILMMPSASRHRLPLWGFPVLMFALGAAWAWRYLAVRRS